MKNNSEKWELRFNEAKGLLLLELLPSPKKDNSKKDLILLPEDVQRQRELEEEEELRALNKFRVVSISGEEAINLEKGNVIGVAKSRFNNMDVILIDTKEYYLIAAQDARVVYKNL